MRIGGRSGKKGTGGRDFDTAVPEANGEKDALSRPRWLMGSAEAGA